jgi:hypothetical protein
VAESRLVPVVFLLAREPRTFLEMASIRRRSLAGVRWIVEVVVRSVEEGPIVSSRFVEHGPYDSPEEALAAFDAHEVEWMEGLGPYERTCT